MKPERVVGSCPAPAGSLSDSSPAAPGADEFEVQAMPYTLSLLAARGITFNADPGDDRRPERDPADLEGEAPDHLQEG